MTPKTGVEKTNTNLLFKKNYNKLKQAHQRYAKKIGVEYRLFEYDEKYKEYYDFFRTNYPEINEYSIVNFYKINLMYELSEKYDEILY